jgi:hypothetical protein
MHKRGFFYLLLFGAFFSVGAVALSGAVLCDDLIRYCHNRHILAEAENSIERLQSLNSEYDALLDQLEKDPDVLKRIAPVTLGTEPDDPDMIYPRARASELAIARKTLVEEAGRTDAGPTIPQWLQRCSDPPKRIALFIAGASLVLISLVCFTPGAQEKN